MAVESSQVEYVKSNIVSDAASNGGRKGQTPLLSGVRHAAFPRIPKSERVAGVTRYRKFFFWNKNPDRDAAYETKMYLEHPSTAGDRFYLGLGGHLDTQGDLTANDPVWTGCGQLNTPLTAGVSTTVKLDMEAGDFVFPNGGLLHISNKFMAGQSVADGIRVGDSMAWNSSAGQWRKIGATDNIDYPNGLFLGGGLVMTDSGSNHEEWLGIADNLHEDEVIGCGTGTDAAPELSTFSHATSGLCAQPDMLPVITAACGAVERTVYVDVDGSCSGYCSAGQLNMSNGVWITDITWTTAPDGGTDITATYREKCHSYSGNTVTVQLETGTTPENSYAAANTFGAGCIQAGDIEPYFSHWSESNSHGGTYDETSYPPELDNLGSDTETWTITFTGVGTFTCSGALAGTVGSGTTGADFSPGNPDTGEPYFTLRSAGWAGTWSNSGTADVITFKTRPAAAPVWFKQVVPAGTAADADNTVVFGTYWE